MIQRLKKMNQEIINNIYIQLYKKLLNDLRSFLVLIKILLSLTYKYEKTYYEKIK